MFSPLAPDDCTAVAGEAEQMGASAREQPCQPEHGSHVWGQRECEMTFGCQSPEKKKNNSIDKKNNPNNTHNMDNHNDNGNKQNKNGIYK